MKTVDNNHPSVRLLMIEGVWQLLFPLGGWYAMHRESSFIEPLDLVIAIYILDLEHASRYWDDWQNYENFIQNIPLSEGRKFGYINRTLHLLRWQANAYGEPGQFVPFAPPSSDVQEIVFAAQELARVRSGAGESLSSCDLLYCVCCQDPSLSETLQRAGLQLDKLAAAVTSTSTREGG